MMNPRPLGARRTVQLLVIITILVWATQVLLTQWGYGALILPSQSSQSSITMPEPVLELRSEASVDGSPVTLKQVCRWAAEDEAVLAPLGDTVLTRLSQQNPVGVVQVADIRTALHDAGANLSHIRFSGAATCAVRRSEVDDATFAQLLSHINDGDEAATTQPSSNVESILAEAKQTPLKDLLVTDLLDRLKLDAQKVQINFDDRDTPTLILTSPRCRFDIDGTQAGALGSVSWDVLIRTDTTERRATITAKALAWADQVVLTRPLSKGQEVLAQDVAARKTLVDKLDQSFVTDASTAVGQLLAKNMKRGDILTTGDLKSPPLVLKDQPVTVAMTIGGHTIETVARALDTGAKGEAVQAKNEANGETYSVIVTGKGEGRLQTSKDQTGVATVDDGQTR